VPIKTNVQYLCRSAKQGAIYNESNLYTKEVCLGWKEWQWLHLNGHRAVLFNCEFAKKKNNNLGFPVKNDQPFTLLVNLSLCYIITYCMLHCIFLFTGFHSFTTGFVFLFGADW